MCLAIRYYATGCNYSVVGDFQGVHKSTVSHCVREVTTFLYVNQQDYIHFPNTPQEMYTGAAAFYDRFGEKPLCLGAVDGTHIPIIAPRVRENNYVNRKNYHSLNVMVNIILCTTFILTTKSDIFLFRLLSE